MNVADDETRTSEIPIVMTRWLHGLKFLIQNQSVWPQELERVSLKRTLERTLTRKKI